MIDSRRHHTKTSTSIIVKEVAAPGAAHRGCPLTGRRRHSPSTPATTTTARQGRLEVEVRLHEGEVVGPASGPRTASTQGRDVPNEVGADMSSIETSVISHTVKSRGILRQVCIRETGTGWLLGSAVGRAQLGKMIRPPLWPWPWPQSPFPWRSPHVLSCPRFPRKPLPPWSHRRAWKARHRPLCCRRHRQKEEH